MVRGKARRLLALIEASLEILQQVQPATVAPHPPGPTGRPAPSRKTTAVGSRYPAVSIWSASPVTWRKLARLGIRPIRQALCQEWSPGGSTRSPWVGSGGASGGWGSGRQDGV
jgi:hypothetical protein